MLQNPLQKTKLLLTGMLVSVALARLEKKKQRCGSPGFCRTQGQSGTTFIEKLILVLTCKEWSPRKEKKKTKLHLGCGFVAISLCEAGRSLPSSCTARATKNLHVWFFLFCVYLYPVNLGKGSIQSITGLQQMLQDTVCCRSHHIYQLHVSATDKTCKTARNTCI